LATKLINQQQLHQYHTWQEKVSDDLLENIKDIFDEMHSSEKARFLQKLQGQVKPKDTNST
jgi:hypothetical protein